MTTARRKTVSRGTVRATSLVPAAAVLQHILLLRGHKVLLDADLALLYGVETRVLVQAVKRSLDRFPEDFMFQLTNQELAILRSQTVISRLRHGGRRSAPYAFTEQGVAMLNPPLAPKKRPIGFIG